MYLQSPFVAELSHPEGFTARMTASWWRSSAGGDGELRRKKASLRREFRHK